MMTLLAAVERSHEEKLLIVTPRLALSDRCEREAFSSIIARRGPLQLIAANLETEVS